MPMATSKLPLTLLLMMVIVSAGSLIQLQPASATFPGANGKIAFARNMEAAALHYEIFTVNPDGSGLTQLTFTAAGVNNIAPRWSADGTKIVFMSDMSGNDEVWVMNADGSGQTQITHTTPPELSGFPAFSPDGSKIVFVRGTNTLGTTNIWVMNADGSNLQQLTTSGFDILLPVWSPDGSKIAFTSYRTGNAEIWVMNPDGSSQTDISNNPANDGGSEWSPDGKMIAFKSDRNDGISRIWVMSADGSNLQQLSNPPNGLSDFFPAWSPDGTKIAFVREALSILVMNADGSNPVDITQSQPNSDTDTFPNWQPIHARPVGGFTLPTNKLEIVTPYLTLAGLVAAVSAVIVVKKRR